MTASFELVLCAPAGQERVSGVTALRFEAPDGARGVQAGHEPALALLEAGVVRVRCGDGVSFVATEGGMAWIERAEVRLVSRWIVRAPSLEALVRLIERRHQVRARLEEHARLQAERHELATRRALARLKREVSW